MGKKRPRKDSQVSEQAPDGVIFCREDLDPETRRYWNHGRTLFSKFNDGIWLTNDMFFSVTPESIASYIATYISAQGVSTIIDGFCGVGGNSIQFAKHVDKVIAIDCDPVLVSCARHNAAIYGVQDKIEFLVGDFFDLQNVYDADAVFLSPPWGGPKYLSKTIFDLVGMEPYGLYDLMKAARKLSPNVALYIPKSSDLVQLLAEAENYLDEKSELTSQELESTIPRPEPLNESESLLLSYLHINNKCKAICAFYGSLAYGADDLAVPLNPDVLVST
ncbi:S-adenosyl-L-methionine-dependent methyltransferase [Lipomyces oligophaga]|uniref:S-adenosyl-L-methionine-dependent methyltransferase n=1 Tax=Lipomyces oligophaga TaxID=45792 RepID=UPI0034CDB461